MNDEAYTNAAAKTTIQDAIAAARVLGLGGAGLVGIDRGGIVVPSDPSAPSTPSSPATPASSSSRRHVTLLQYPWAFPMSKRLAQNDVDFYVPRTDPAGPSMSDAINSIDTAALSTPGCSSFVYTRRSFEPFIRDLFDQFSETQDRRRVHVHDRDRRLPAGVPLRLLRACAGSRTTCGSTRASPDSCRGSCCAG